jgi:hypothetical protein
VLPDIRWSGDVGLEEQQTIKGRCQRDEVPLQEHYGMTRNELSNGII